MRIAVIKKDDCQPRRCSYECQSYCPGVRTGEETVVVDEKSGKPRINEDLCSGCGICTHKCPLHAIHVVNLPGELEGKCVHRYMPNGFALYGLPIPRKGSVIGLVGKNGTGKTTSLQILSRALRPNLGRPNGAEKDDLNEFFRGSELLAYFRDIEKLRLIYKPQNVDVIPRLTGGSVGEILSRVDERGEVEKLMKDLELDAISDRDVGNLSGGELQRLAIAAAAAREGDVYYFDEPSSHLDVYQRLKAARVIRKIAETASVIVVEHDLAALDYVCDQVHVVYGQPGVYGVISSPQGVRSGINSFLDGYLKTENIRFRKEPIKFDVRPSLRAEGGGKELFSYGDLRKSFPDFELEVTPGKLYRGEVIGVVGPNAIGKTTFIRMMAGEIEPTSGTVKSNLSISHKPQYLERADADVRSYILSAVGEFDQMFEPEIAGPLELSRLMDRRVEELSGGELQRVAIACCLGKPADIYLLDEPSAYLDAEERLQVARVIRRIVEKRESCGFVVDHDMLCIDIISDRLLVFSGTPGKHGRTNGPLEMRSGINMFLSHVGVTFRRDPQTGRPRANKPGSALDREQRERGEYFYL
ncbi:MAG: ribosome biogenesis/translation initiation ATPase RLI [Candidatus Hadarchaeales archaeon]